MIYRVGNIVRDARIAIDENKESEQLIRDEDIDTLSLNELIGSKVTEAVRMVLTEAPAHLLDGGEHFGDTVHWSDRASGWTLLPEDFMRLIVFKMSDWERPVYEPITAADPRYQLQSSRCKGLRGNPQKPIAAIVARADGRVLELYSCKDTTALVEQALYLPEPRIDHDGGIAIPQRCYRAAVYQTASLVLAAIGQADLSHAMSEISKQLLI